MGRIEWVIANEYQVRETRARRTRVGRTRVERGSNVKCAALIVPRSQGLDEPGACQLVGEEFPSICGPCAPYGLPDGVPPPPVPPSGPGLEVVTYSARRRPERGRRGGAGDVRRWFRGDAATGIHG